MKFFAKLLLVLVGIVSGLVAAPLPAGWSAADVGITKPLGSQSYTPEAARFDVSGAGADIWGTADQFHFVYQPWSGDGEWVVQVDSIQNTNVWAKAGLMVRQSLAVGSPHALLALTPGSGVAFQRRKVADGSSINISMLGYAAPSWLKLVRRGLQFECYTSQDGKTWHYWTTDTIDLPPNVFVGLALTSHRSGVLASAAFTQFDATTPLPADFPSGWTGQDIGSPALTGSGDYLPEGGLTTLRGAGADIWGTADQFQFASQPWTGNVVLVARVDSLLNTNGWAKAGLMIRESLTAGSRQAMVVLSPSNGVAFQRRTTTDGTSLNTAQAGITIPGWIKLERWGDRFDAFYSIDSLTWRYFGTETITMPPSVFIGLAVTSHNASKLTESVFSHFDYRQTAAPGGLWGEYFKGKAFNTSVLQRLDSTVNFTWGAASPAPAVPVDGFSVRWTGSITPDVTQAYTFSTVSDDGVRLWVNGQLLIDNWTLHGATENTGTVTLNAGISYPIKMEYYDNTGSATARLLWTAADRGKAPIAPTFFTPSQYPDSDADGIPDYWETLHGLDPLKASDAKTIDPKSSLGLTYLQEYLIATHPDSPDTDGDGIPDIADPFPLDYYNGAAPLLTIIGGDQQSALAGTFNINPFDVAVWRSDGSGPLVHAPVSFSITSGAGLLNDAANSTEQSTTYVTQTDNDGTAQASYQQPAITGVTSRITVTAGTAVTRFTTMSLPELPPENIKAVAISSTQIMLSWSGDWGVTRYIVERKANDGSYSVVSIIENALSCIDVGLNAGQTYTYRIKAQRSGINSDYADPIDVKTLNSGADFPVVNLRTWLKSDSGVITSESGVSQWFDLSGHGNHASQDDSNIRPQWVDNEINGQPVIRFNGGGTVLRLPDLMAGGNQGEVFIVARLKNFDNTYNGLCQFGVANGTAYSNDNVDTRGTGTIWDDFGINNGDGFDGPGADVLTGWHTYNATVSEQGQDLRFNGNLLTHRDHPASSPSAQFRTDPMIGTDVWNEYFNGDIAEVIVFDHVLTDAERETVQSYFALRYALLAKPVLSGFAQSSTEANLSWPLNADGNPPTSATLERMDGDGNFQVIATISDASSYTDGGLTPGLDYTYRLKIATSAYSDNVTVRLPVLANIPTTGLRLWLSGSVGVPASGVVVKWYDQSGLGNHAVTADMNSCPAVAPDGANGRAVVRFNGAQEMDLPDVLAGASAGEIIAVVKVVDKSLGNYEDGNNKLWNFNQNGAGYYKSEADPETYYHYNTFGFDDSGESTEVPVSLVSNYHVFDTRSSPELWAEYYNGVLHHSADGQTATFNSAPNIGSGVFAGDFAEILIYDHALTDEERLSVNAYLKDRYAIAGPIVELGKPKLVGFAQTPTAANLTVGTTLAGNSDASIALERVDADGNFQVIATISSAEAYTDNGLTPGQSYTYRAKIVDGTALHPYSDPVTVQLPILPNILKTGMRLWLSSGVGIPSSGAVGTWYDQSGLGNNATQGAEPNQPLVVSGQINGMPVVHFDATQNQYLNLPDFMSGASGGDAFVVLRRDKTYPYISGLWTLGNGPGSRYPEYNKQIQDDFASTQWTYTGQAPSFLGDFHLYNVGGDATTWFQKLNGSTYTARAYNTVSFRADPTIGAGLGGGVPFAGDFAEIIVYDKVLTAAERTSVENYLLAKYDTAAPSTPSALTAVGVTDSEINLSWTASTDNIAVASYDVYCGGSLIGSSVSPSFLVTGLTANTEYSLTVRACDAAGNTSALSDALIVATSVEKSPPTVPTGITVSNLTPNSFTLTWTASTDNVGVAFYDVYRDGTLIGSPNASTFNVSGLSPSKAYVMRLRSGDAAGNVSSLVSSLTVTTPPLPIAVAVDSDSDGMPDMWELAYGLNPLIRDAEGDLDADGVSNSNDARPNQSSVGSITVTITAPLTGVIIP